MDYFPRRIQLDRTPGLRSAHHPRRRRTLPFPTRFRPTPTRLRPDTRPFCGLVPASSAGPFENHNAASTALAVPSSREPAHHFTSLAQWPAIAKSTASARSPGVTGPDWPLPRTRRTLSAWPFRLFNLGPGNEDRIRHSGRISAAIDAGMNASRVVAGSRRSHCLASPTAAPASTRTARSLLLDSGVPRAPICVSLLEPSPVHCDSFGWSRRLPSADFATAMIVECHLNFVLIYICIQVLINVSP